MKELKKEFEEKFCYEMMNLDKTNRHHYINPRVADNPQIIINWFESKLKQEIEDAKPKWISVKDRLPPEKRYVIGYIKDAGSIVMCSKTLTSDDALWQHVTHWMPLPESPELKEKL